MTIDDTATTDLDAIARRAFMALARHDLDHPELIWAEGAVDHFLPVGDAVGREAIVGYFRDMFAAIPDLDIAVERTVAAPPYVVVQWRLTGTFTGRRLQGVRPTGRRIDLRGCDVAEIRDGLVVDNTVYWDGAEFARQVGLLPAQGSRADRALLRAFNASTWVRGLGRRPAKGPRDA